MHTEVEIWTNQPSLKGDLKICSKSTEHPCRSAISVRLRHGCSPVNLLHTFRTYFPKNTSGGLLLFLVKLQTENLFLLKVGLLSSNKNCFICLS